MMTPHKSTKSKKSRSNSDCGESMTIKYLFFYNIYTMVWYTDLLDDPGPFLTNREYQNTEYKSKNKRKKIVNNA